VGQGLIQASVQAFGQIVETVETTHAPPESLTNDVVIVPEIDVFDLFYWSGASDGGARDEVRAVARVRTRTSIWTNGERIWRDVYEAPREYSDPFSRTVREDVRHAADVVSRALSACVRHAAQECARNETLRSRLVEAQLASTGQLYRSAPNTRRGSHARTVAVLGLRGLVVSDDEAMILTDRLRVELARVSGFRLVEREQLERILEEQGLQTSGICDTEECIVEIGRLLGAGYVVTGAVGRLGQTYTVSARMVDVETGQVVKHAAEDCTCQIDGMLRSIRAIAEALSRP